MALRFDGLCVAQTVAAQMRSVGLQRGGRKYCCQHFRHVFQSGGGCDQDVVLRYDLNAIEDFHLELGILGGLDS